MNPLVFIDTETGGLDPEKHSLLSIALVVWKRDEGIIASKELFIKSQEYSFTKEAQKINKFDKAQHEINALEPKDVISQIELFLSKYYPALKEIELAGHNTQFDVAFLKTFLKQNNRSFNQLFSHRIVDTYSLLKLLTDAALIPEGINSSAKAFSYYKIKVENRHSALGDAIATANLYAKMVEQIKIQ